MRGRSAAGQHTTSRIIQSRNLIISLDRYASTSGKVQLDCTSARNSSSETTFTPSSRAFSPFEPASSPTPTHQAFRFVTVQLGKSPGEDHPCPRECFFLLARLPDEIEAVSLHVFDHPPVLHISEVIDDRPRHFLSALVPREELALRCVTRP